VRHEFRGTSLTITYDEVCIHAGSCVRTQPNVFDIDRAPWIDPDGASFQVVEATVAACPSGALGIARKAP
jgi:uncharacterized Fe-S cluster protein YjdI